MQTLVILGGTSAVAFAYARLEVARGRDICLVGRNEKQLLLNAEDLRARGQGHINTYVCNLGNTSSVKKHWKVIEQQCSEIDEVLLAYGVLGVQDDTQASSVKLRVVLDTNFTSAALWCELAFSAFAFQGFGQISVIGSVAGDRGRQSNYHYGAAKGALDVFCSGMAHRAAKLKESRVGVLLVKPGFIDAPMTDHLDKGGFLWASPDKIAKTIQKAVRKKQTKIYAPWFWRYILLIIRCLPYPIFKKSNL